MYDWTGPDPMVSRMRAANYARKQTDLRVRAINSPNQFFMGDLIALWVPVSILSCVAFAGAFVYSLMPPLAIDWLATSDQKTRWIIVAALTVALAAWYIRDKRKFKLYPIAEVAFGAALSVQGVFQQDVHASNFTLLATVIAFVTGVRMITDGFKRFDEFRTGWLFKRWGRKYIWRQSKRGLRAMRYA